MGWKVLAAALAVLASAAQAGPRTKAAEGDLEGDWTNVTQTPFERPAGVPLTFPTKAQGDAYEAAVVAKAKAFDNAYGQAASEWTPIWPMTRIDGRVRTSLLVAPADGRIHYRPEAQARFDAVRAVAGGSEFSDGPEQRTTSDRCLTGGGDTGGPPLLNHHSGSAIQIVQAPGVVAIRVEMNHDVRIVRLGGRHPPPAMRMWMGDSIGWWEGRTLVVETTNFHPQDGDRAKYVRSPAARITERFTRTGPAELRYSFEVDDPATVTEPWRGELVFRPETSPIWEYACHEGNYAMTSILAGARRREAEAAGAVAAK